MDYSNFAYPKPSGKKKNKKSKYTDYKFAYCEVCGLYKMTTGHHIVHGNGKRLECENEHSVIRVCDDCHKFIHSSKGHKLDKKLKLNLQKEYFKMGKTEDEVRRLMGGKIIIEREN